MYGSIFRMKTLPGKREDVVDVFRSWSKDVRPRSNSEIQAFMLKADADGDELIGVAIAPSEEAYRANNDTPGQNEWFQKMRALLAADPEWHDGEFLKGE